MAEATKAIRDGAHSAKPKRLAKSAREQQLLDIAEGLFTTQGYDATSVEDIARAAGVTRPIIYEHFGSLEGVLLACVERALAGYKRALAEAVRAASPATPGARVERGSQVFFSMLESNPQRWILLFTNTTALSGHFAERLAEVRFATVDLIADLVRASAPHAADERLQACAHAIAGVGMHMGYWWLHHPNIPRERIIAYHRDFIVGGINRLLADQTEPF